MDDWNDFDDFLLDLVHTDDYEPTLDDILYVDIDEDAYVAIRYEDSDDTDTDHDSDDTDTAQEASPVRATRLKSPFLVDDKDVDESEICNVIEFLKEHDDRYKVPQNDPKYARIASDAEAILKQAFSKLSQRFSAKIIPSGSFYEDLKVESPDEFDFMAEIKSLSSPGSIDVVPSDRPGFVHATILDPNTLSLWKDCMSFVCQHKQRQEDCKSCFLGTNENKGTIVLAPEKVQKEFRKEINQAMIKAELPKGWKHGGYNSPRYSGHRRHGPATLFQFVYTAKKVEYKITLDVTLSIGLPLPFNSNKLNFHAFDRMERSHPLRALLRNTLKTGPGMHLIPLYSKLHTRTGYFGHKNSWRVSCSLVEREILNTFSQNDPDSIPHRCIRLMKWIRDAYLADEKQETTKSRKKKKQESVKKSSATAKENKKKVPDAESKDSNSAIAVASDGTNERWRQNFYQIFPKPENETDESERSTYSCSSAPQPLQDDVDFYHNPGIIRYEYEDREVDTMTTSLTSKEYYGAKNYVSSIEIKTFVMYMIEKCPYSDGWSEGLIPDIIISVFRRIAEMYDKGGYLQNFFFDVPVCSPLSANRRQIAKEKLNKLIMRLTEGKWKSLINDQIMSDMWKTHQPQLF